MNTNLPSTPVDLANELKTGIHLAEFLNNYLGYKAVKKVSRLRHEIPRLYDPFCIVKREFNMPWSSEQTIVGKKMVFFYLFLDL